MTVPQQGSTSIFFGNSSNTIFTFPWIGYSSSTINAYLVSPVGVQTMLNPAQFLVALNAAAPGQSWGIGGTVTYPLTGPPLPTGWQLIVQRAVPYSQQTQVNNQTAYPASTQTALDTLCFEIQQAVARTGQIRGTWVTGNFYNFGDTVTDGVNGMNTGNLYACANANTSGTWATDVANGDWVLALNIQAIINSLPILPANTLFGNATNSAATPIATALTALIDSSISNTQGAILYRSASAWAALAPGTAGQFLATEGAGANPQWLPAVGTGTITGVTAGTGLTGGGASGGVTVAFATIANNALLANTSGGTLAPGATTLSALIDSAISNTQGSILYRSAAAWVALGPGSAAQLLGSGGAAANPSWTAVTGSGNVVLATSPTLVTPALGTPASGNLSNCTNIPTSLMNALGVGSIAFLAGTSTNSGFTAGSTYAAAGLVQASLFGLNSANPGLALNGSVSGTWTALQTAAAVGGNQTVTLFQRTA